MRHTSILAIVAALITTQAYAGNLVEPVVVPPPIVVEADSDWSGFHVGLYAGSGRSIWNDPFWSFFDFDYTLVGANAGYLVDLGNFVVGGEVSYELSQTNPVIPNTDTTRLGIDLIAGYDAGTVMPFLSLGAANATSAVLPAGGVNGISGAIGANFMVTDNIMLTGKIRRTQWDMSPLIFFPDQTSTDFVLGVAYKF